MLALGSVIERALRLVPGSLDQPKELQKVDQAPQEDDPPEKTPKPLDKLIRHSAPVYSGANFMS